MRNSPSRPMNVHVGGGSRAERAFVPEVIVPGIPPTPDHDLIYRGGKTIPKLAYRNFYIGGQASWNETDIKNIDDALSAVMTDEGLNEIIQQYFNRPIETLFRGSQVVAGRKPRLVTQASIERTVALLFRNNAFAGFDLESTVVNFMLPSGTILTDDDSPRAGRARGQPSDIPFEDEASSLEGLGGYHGSVHITSAEGRKTVYYAVGVFSEARDGQQNGIVAFDQPWKNVVATFYHELCEARTDPDVEDVIKGILPDSALGWTSNQGFECGDFPVFEAGRDLKKVFVEVKLKNGKTLPVQLQYSNRVHGPEGPASSDRASGHHHEKHEKHEKHKKAVKCWPK